MKKELELVYISGKISDGLKIADSEGQQQYKDVFIDAAEKLIKERDCLVFLPGENHSRIGERMNWTWRDYMKHDLGYIKKADTVFMLKNWKESKGARTENRYSRLLGKKIIYEEDKCPT